MMDHGSSVLLSIALASVKEYCQISTCAMMQACIQTCIQILPSGSNVTSGNKIRKCLLEVYAVPASVRILHGAADAF